MDPFPIVPVPSEPMGDRESLREVQVDVHSLHDALADLRRQLERQRTLLRALFGLLQERHRLTEADLLDHFRRATAERAAPAPKMCTRCGRPVSLKFEKCMYCEAPQPAASAFELV